MATLFEDMESISNFLANSEFVKQHKHLPMIITLTIEELCFVLNAIACYAKHKGKNNAIQIPLHCLNKLQMDSIREMLKKAPHMHYADVVMRIDGQDIKFQADWIKSMVLPQDKED